MTIIIHVFVLNVFIFVASHEERDVAQFNQLNSFSIELSAQVTQRLTEISYSFKISKYWRHTLSNVSNFGRLVGNRLAK